ncbi:putative nucleic acid-binding Zn-ribbon protein [Cytobacillus horneckiae]
MYYRQQPTFIPVPGFPPGSGGGSTNRRLERLENQVQRLEQQNDRIERRLERVDRRLDRIERRLGIGSTQPRS